VIAEGTVLGGRYVIEGLLGDGGMGRVYRARHNTVGRTFAIKVLHASLDPDPTVVARFRREAELAGRLRNDHVVSVIDMGTTEDDEHYIVLEYAPGECLSALMDGPWPEERALELAIQLCDGLQHAHEAGMIHRDFKPDNVLVEQLADGAWHARIVDFGVAILCEQAANVDGDRLTEKGIVVGTPMYMAPEQARGGGIDHRTDLFALGVILYELLTGAPPYEGTGVEVARANVHMATPPMGIRAPGVAVDPVLEALVRKLLAKRPDDRFQTARAVRDAIELYRRDRDAAATLLGPELRAAVSSGAMAPLAQVAAAGRSRAAANSAAPYESVMRSVQMQPLARTELVPTPAPAPPPDDAVCDDPTLVPRRRRRAGIVIAGALVLAAVAVVIWIARGSNDDAATTVARRTDLATAPPALPMAASMPAPPTSQPTQQLDVEPIAQAPKRPTTNKPRPGSPLPPTAVPPTPQQIETAPSTQQLAQLYSHVGRELTAASRKDPNATIDLWPRYRWIRFMEAVKTPAKRAAAAAILTKLLDDLHATKT
jgi:hypothetical protein